MKFRGVMIDALSMREFTHIATTISKLTKESVLRISSDKVYFIVSDEYCGLRPPLIWCELDQSSFFSEFLMEGVDEEYRDIYLGFNTGNLARSLVTLKQNAKCLKIKLSKKHFPCLTIEIESPVINLAHTRQVVHDIPITIIPRKSWQDFSGPCDQNYNITIELPSLKQIKAVVDRMRNMSSDIIIKANKDGHMIFQIKTDLVTVSSKFQNLNVENHNDDKDTEDDSEDEKHYIVCRIDIKMFANILIANQTHYSKTLCSMIHKKLVNLFFEKEDMMTFQCFLPAIVF